MTNGMNRSPSITSATRTKTSSRFKRKQRTPCLQAGIPLRTAKKRSKIIASKETAIRSRVPLRTFLDTLFRPALWHFEVTMFAKRRSCATIALTPNMGLLRYLKTKNLQPSSPKTSSRSIIRRQKNENRGRSSTYRSGLGLFYICSAR